MDDVVFVKVLYCVQGLGEKLESLNLTENIFSVLMVK